MKRHPVVGAQILSRFPQFAPTTRYVRHHHERVDGGGYPDGLRDEAIPLGARIIAVADALDAMVNTRPYRRALSPEFIKAEFARQRGRQWDERVVDRLFDLVDGGRIALTSERAPNVEQAAPPGPARNEGHVVR
jgi:HD-GYP domain-containing protein (c-di-GMP phosphodiesterase class II)